ncbi:bifunctional serine/threonine-protein kinase/ABC transporter substrate-binding protein [Streptomyces sp. SP18CS02]|uniref:bifunctional serine/threonine-protein kinase/ABC transporter substrate-binding protein n=1 Tax=Streptomyces sp. SP18CS02 TaxID=3002531 RepID=UPI002E7946CA|nr:bifunctional serine/threonine-protein kinase/ABC transporter substrate-binding protein [Streptomyces sp. SP18CS02]MEE1757512.1 bifunctional serine/threonine-protein kinase/ABC transporter substrate-binding protein [Streptomyces sp. SP18CS02]
MEPLRSSDPSRIAGHRLLGRLGAGGMGVVYLARSPVGPLVALKVLQAEYAEEEGFKERFRREVAVARRITSRWAVPVVDADADARAPWLATAFVPGPSLAEAVTAYGPLTGRGLRLLGGRLALALSEVHRAGLVHRDLKPGNVLLAHDGPRLIDFGIARAPEDTVLTATGLVVGTPGYLSPEQALGQGEGTVGPPSDLFSLGCVLAFAATGRPPFGSGPVDALLYRAVHDSPDLDGVPASVLEVVRRCLEKDPERRPVAEDVVRELAEDGAEEGGDAPGWLPEAVTRLIAERSTAALGLPDVDNTQVAVAEDPAGRPEGTAGESAAAAPDGVAGGTAPDGDGSAGAGEDTAKDTADDAAGRGPGRRRLLLAGGAVVLAAGGGTGLWALTRGEDRRPGATSSGRASYTLAAQGDLSGEHRETGRAQERGLRLAVEEFNARTGRPYDLRAEVVDDKGDPATAARLAKELTADASVLAVVGPSTDATAEAALPAYDAALLPVVAVSPGAITLANGGFRSFLHARLPDTLMPFYLAPYLRGPGRSRTIGIINDRAGDAYAWEISSTISRLLQKDRYPSVPKVVGLLRADFGPAVDAMVAGGADSVVYAGPHDRAALIARTLRERDFTGARVSGPALLDPRFLSAAREAAEGWVIAAPVVDASVKPEARTFATAYGRRYGQAPPRWAAEAYDVSGMLLKALSTLPKGRRTREDLLAAVRAATYRGITKAFAFQPNAASLVIDGTGVFLWRVERGRFVYAGPAPLA